MDKNLARLRSFRIHAAAAMALLIVEFLLGIYSALFVEFPSDLVRGNAWAWTMSKSAVVVAHAIIGTLILLVSAVTLGRGIASRSRAAILGSAAGFLLTLFAWLGGAWFLSNVQNDAASFLMAIGFIGALSSYGVAFYFAGPAGAAIPR